MTPTALRSTRAAALALAATLLTSVPTTTSAATGEVTEPASSPLRIATYNVSAQKPVRRTVQDARALAAESPDVIALQEMASWKRRQAVLKAVADCDTCVYDGYFPAAAVPGGTPILYRSDKFTLLDQGSERVTDDTYVGERGAGPATIRAKWVNWVRLRDNATRRQVYVLNNHFVPTVQGGNGGPNSMHRRVGIYRRHMSGLTDIISEIRRTTGGMIFVTGDFNVNYRNDSVRQASMFPYHALGQLGITSSFQNVSVPKEGTHVLSNGFSKRLIDYVLNLRRRAVSSQDHHIIFGLHSDHRAMVADYTLWSRACFVRRQNTC